jgi:hypothetical protein
VFGQLSRVNNHRKGFTPLVEFILVVHLSDLGQEFISRTSKAAADGIPMAAVAEILLDKILSPQVPPLEPSVMQK